MPNTNFYRAAEHGDDEGVRPLGRRADRSGDRTRGTGLGGGRVPGTGAELRRVLPAPPGYLQRVREICDEYDVLFVADETITSFGRIGDYFAMNASESSRTSSPAPRG